jgi:hypothetical protein
MSAASNRAEVELQVPEKAANALTRLALAPLRAPGASQFLWI